MTIPPEFRAEADSLPAPLRALLDAELAAGNSIAQVGSCFPAPPAGAYVTLTNPITTRSRESGGGVFSRFINSLNSHSFSDESQFYFVLEPLLPPPPDPDMDAIREAHLPKNHSNYTSPFDPDSAAGRFRRSMELDYVRWRDGDGWCVVWEQMQGKIHSHGREPVEPILKVALVRTESPAMRSVVECSRHLLDVLQ